MKPILLAALAACSVLLASCSATGGGGFTNDLFIAYTGNGVEVQNTKITAPPGQESQTANGVGYNTKNKTAYITYLDGRTQRLKITGAGFGGGVAALFLEDGSKIMVNVHTGNVTVQPSPYDTLPQK